MTDPFAVNAALTGVTGGQAQLATPALIIDLPAMKRNIAAMAARTQASKIALRPHAKTHKSAEIARRQRAAGAVGICCAKLAEAEALAEKGADQILITSPIVSAQALARLARLNRASDGLGVVVDRMEGVAEFGAAARASGRTLRVLVDLDVGLHRTGVAPGDEAVALAAAVAAEDGLIFDGLQAYAGQIMHEADPALRRSKAEAVAGKVVSVRDALVQRDLAPRLITGGGTGTFDLDAAGGVFNELQVGSYVFMDRDYNDVWTKADRTPPFETALFVQTRVISATLPQLATTDAGFKSFATDKGDPVIASGARPDVSYFYFGDEQGGVLCENPADRPQVGDVLTCTVPHCDPTVNLYDVYHVVEDGRLVALWPIDARGRSY